MGLYRYQGLLEEGKKIKGVIDADSEIAAKEQLRKDSILLTSLKPLKAEEREKKLPPLFYYLLQGK
ncbi:MAG: hypothetical protein LVR00_08420 [Rhabdochlamydiaceae bacterium]|jgi:type II secretory pathway component PulF